MIAGILSGYSCATLESVVNEAGMIACYNKSDCITTEHMIEAILRSVFNVKIPYGIEEMPEIDLSNHNYASEMIYHEAGHAVIAELIEPKTVALMSAFTRDLEEGGFIRHINKGRPIDLKMIEGRILVSLAGKAAVDVKYGVNSIGTRLVESGEQRKIIQNATRRNKMMTGGNNMNETIEAEGNLQDVIELMANLRKNKEPLLHCSIFIELKAKNMETLKELQQDISMELTRSKISVDRLTLRQKEGFLSAIITSVHSMDECCPQDQ